MSSDKGSAIYRSRTPKRGSQEEEEEEEERETNVKILVISDPILSFVTREKKRKGLI